MATIHSESIRPTHDVQELDFSDYVKCPECKKESFHESFEYTDVEVSRVVPQPYDTTRIEAGPGESITLESYNRSTGRATFVIGDHVLEVPWERMLAAHRDHDVIGYCDEQSKRINELLEARAIFEPETLPSWSIDEVSAEGGSVEDFIPDGRLIAIGAPTDPPSTFEDNDEGDQD